MTAQKPPQTDDSPDGSFFSAFWKAALAVGGLGTVGAFVFWDLYKSWFETAVAAKLFTQVNEQSTFVLMLVFIALAFVFSTVVVTFGFLLLQKKRSR